MKKILIMVIIFLFCYNCFAEDFSVTITERMKKLEQAQETDSKYLQHLQQEIQVVTQRIIARGGAINENNVILKTITQKTEEIPNEKIDTITNTTDTIQ